ncbi:MAG: TRAP transporter small permease [Acidimicrobiia bacterium]
MVDRIAGGLHLVSRSIESVLRLLLAILLGALTCLLFVQVVLRFGFNRSIDWAEEVPRIMLIWLVFVGMAATVRGQHLTIDVLKDHYWLRIFSMVIKLLFLGFLAVWGTVLVTKVASQQMPITQVSRAWQYAAAPVGGALAMVVGLDELIQLLKAGPGAPPEAVAGGLTEEGWARASVD